MLTKLLLKIVRESYHDEYHTVIQKLENQCNHNVIDFLEFNNFHDIWNKFCMKSKNKKQFLLFFNQWFDALKTIKFLKKLSYSNKI